MIELGTEKRSFGADRYGRGNTDMEIKEYNFYRVSEMSGIKGYYYVHHIEGDKVIMEHTNEPDAREMEGRTMTVKIRRFSEVCC